MTLKLQIFLLFFYCLKLSETKILENNRTSRIADGDVIDIIYYPFLVSIWCENFQIGDRTEDMKMYFCGGTLITMQHVLTSADCISNFAQKYIRVRAGSSDRLIDGIVLNVKHIYVHSDFNAKRRNFNDNLAIILLEKPLNRSSEINKIPLVNENVTITEGTIVKVAGWGETETDLAYVRWLRRTSLAIMSRQKCKSLTELVLNHDYIPLETVICAESAKSYEINNICYGDYGGPMVYNNTLVGVASIGAQCQIDEFIGGVFMNISHYRKWIDSVINA